MQNLGQDQGHNLAADQGQGHQPEVQSQEVGLTEVGQDRQEVGQDRQEVGQDRQEVGQDQGVGQGQRAGHEVGHAVDPNHLVSAQTGIILSSQLFIIH